MMFLLFIGYFIGIIVTLMALIVRVDESPTLSRTKIASAYGAAVLLISLLWPIAAPIALIIHFKSVVRALRDVIAGNVRDDA